MTRRLRWLFHRHSKSRVYFSERVLWILGNTQNDNLRFSNLINARAQTYPVRYSGMVGIKQPLKYFGNWPINWSRGFFRSLQQPRHLLTIVLLSLEARRSKTFALLRTWSSCNHNALAFGGGGARGGPRVDSLLAEWLGKSCLEVVH